MNEPDIETDEAYAEGTSDGYTSSIATEIWEGIQENGRTYPQHGEHSYGMPIDEAEKHRMDLQHYKYAMVMHGRNYLAPIRSSPSYILDLGTGTGIWCIEIADQFPSAYVIGVDIAPIQPEFIPPNCQFEIDDIEKVWTWNTFDYIHLRDPLLIIRDWPKLMKQAYDHLEPGGYFEVASLHPLPMCDDGPMSENSAYLQGWKKFIEASYSFGAPCDLAPKFKDYLANHGFVDIQEHIFKIPSSPWPEDKQMKLIGALELQNITQGAEAFVMRLFTRVLGWTRREVELALIDFQRDARNQEHRRYFQFIVAYGRKPSQTI